MRLYHWGLLIAIPLALISSQRGRQFFLDWAPIFAFWFVYDRLRLLQPFLLGRVAVQWPDDLEVWLFGWLGGGEAPAIAWRHWLAGNLQSVYGMAISNIAQFVYLSHLFLLYLWLGYLWFRGRSRARDRDNFVTHVRAFTFLHFVGILIYLVLPAAPPWWVSLHGFAQPTAELVANTTMAAAMDGAVVQGMIKSASLWFAAIPSLHGAYPVLLLLLALRSRKRWFLIACTVYMGAMFVTTVVLNQHYIIDLLAGALLAFAACRFAYRVKSFACEIGESHP